MDDAPKLLLRTSEIAQISGVDQKRIEHWMEGDNNIYLDGIAFRPGEKIHRRFSTLDVIRVMLIALLNDHGISPVKVASGLTEQVVDPYDFRSGNADAIPIQKRIEIIFSTLDRLETFFTFDREQERWLFGGKINRPDGGIEFFGDETVIQKVAHGELDAFLTISMGRIVTNYYERFLKFIDAEEEKRK